jgi:hypothetical protein
MPRDALVSVTPRVLDPDDSRRWVDGLEFLVPAAVLEVAGQRHQPTTREFIVPPRTFPWAAPAASALRLRAAFTETPPTSSRLPFSYHVLPETIRDTAAHLIGRWR